MYYYLLIKLYDPLHVSSLKCSSSGGHTVYMQHMVKSLSTRVRGGLSVHRIVKVDCGDAAASPQSTFIILNLKEF